MVIRRHASISATLRYGEAYWQSLDGTLTFYRFVYRWIWLQPPKETAAKKQEREHPKQACIILYALC